MPTPFSCIIEDVDIIWGKVKAMSVSAEKKAERKTKVEYLSQYKYSMEALDRKLEELEEAKARATHITAILDGMPRGTGAVRLNRQLIP